MLLAKKQTRGLQTFQQNVFLRVMQSKQGVAAAQLKRAIIFTGRMTKTNEYASAQNCIKGKSLWHF